MFKSILFFVFIDVFSRIIKAVRYCTIVFVCLWDKVARKKRCFVCYGFRPDIHAFATQKDNFYNLKFSLKTRVYLNIPFKIKIIINKYNFVFLEETINFCLRIKKKKEICLDAYSKHIEANSLFEFYKALIQSVNLDLAYCQIYIELSVDFMRTLKKILGAVEKNPALAGKNPHELFISINKFKRIPFSLLNVVRFISLLANDVILGPWQVVLDIFHRCNTDCVHCWIHSPKARRHLTSEFLNQKISFNMFKRIADDCLGMGVDDITFLADGEPMLNSDFIPMLRYIKSKNPYIRTLTFSNGLSIDKNMSNNIIRHGLDEIWFSIPAATASTYVKICPSRTKEDFYKIKSNVLYLCRLKKIVNNAKSADYCNKNEIGIKRPYCVMAFVLHNLNYQEIISMAHMAVECEVDEMRFQLIHLDRDNKDLKLTQEHIDYLNKNIPLIQEIARGNNINLSTSLRFQLSHMYVPTGDWSRGYFIDKGCPIGFFFSIIKANGDVGLCCSLKVIDNITNKSFKEVWFSERYQRARVAAKYLRYNKDLMFLPSIYHKNEPRGDLLYSERCEYCDNHDMNRKIIEALLNLDLYGIAMGGSRIVDKII